MDIAIIVDHPNSKSFTMAAASAFARGLSSSGHGATLVDLHGDGFNPLWSMADIEGDAVGVPPQDVRAYQELILRSEGL